MHLKLWLHICENQEGRLVLINFEILKEENLLFPNVHLSTR